MSQLNDAAKDEVALLAAQRGVLVFRDQDFIDKGQSLLQNMLVIMVRCIFTQPVVLQKIILIFMLF